MIIGVVVDTLVVTIIKIVVIEEVAAANCGHESLAAAAAAIIELAVAELQSQIVGRISRCCNNNH
jgi:hypothetical protein